MCVWRERDRDLEELACGTGGAGEYRVCRGVDVAAGVQSRPEAEFPFLWDLALFCHLKTFT